ncbi:hypothetical protein Vqi01_34220 [Micromonospora qiuiae]|uniref:Uncharacterized protein n=1 Tax=Micromonospora qiuiae TaxID=502268 RepID=A0ABQ4JDL4_9ACTN|nr:hypothetical protein [Micromonospora qiuiae]GIJ28260.1 hypothetical protein Vqi01_34220 [Micromonospora qiuiae]
MSDVSEQDSPNTYTPPAPKLKGFGRGASLTGLVSADRTAPVSAPTSPPAAQRAADDTESAPGGQVAAARTEAATPTVEESPAPASPNTFEPSSATPSRASSVPVRAEAAPTEAETSGAETSRVTDLPDLSVDPDDPAALVVSPTVLSVPAPLMARFERARRTSTSNTELVLDALRAHLADLPRLVAEARRPAAAAADEPFPWRRTSAQRRAAGKVRRVQLPIRPLVGELYVIDTLVAWVQEQLGAGSRSLGGRINRSEVVVAALDAHLPADRPRGRRPQA